MGIQHWIKMILMGLLVLVVAACSSTGSKQMSSNDQQASVIDADSVAQAYGLGDGDEADFQDEQLSQANDDDANVNDPCERVMRAPAKQTYCFAFDSNRIKEAYKKALHKQANYLVAHPKAKIKLEGNTDNRGSREYNVSLGWRRDQTIARTLEQLGVSPNQIEMVSYGEEKPVALGDSEKAWRLNRRVNLIYKHT